MKNGDVFQFGETKCIVTKITKASFHFYWHAPYTGAFIYERLSKDSFDYEVKTGRIKFLSSPVSGVC